MLLWVPVPGRMGRAPSPERRILDPKARDSTGSGCMAGWSGDVFQGVDVDGDVMGGGRRYVIPVFPDFYKPRAPSVEREGRLGDLRLLSKLRMRS